MFDAPENSFIGAVCRLVSHEDSGHLRPRPLSPGAALGGNEPLVSSLAYHGSKYPFHLRLGKGNQSDWFHPLLPRSSN